MFENSMHSGMVEWSGGVWPWLFGLHGLLSLLFIAVIVFALAVLIRDWRRDHRHSPTRDTYASGSE